MSKLCFLLLLFISVHCYSQDLIGGNLSFANRYGTNTYYITIIYYSQINTAVKRKHIFLNYGDGTSDSLPVDTIPGIAAGNVYADTVSFTHDYLSNGFYNLYFESDFLVDSINNLSHSDTLPLHLEAGFLLTSSFNTDYGSQFPQQQQFYYPCCNTIVQNVGAYNPTGDSLSYSLIAPDSGYSFAGATIDSVTGDLSFTPPQSGRYLFDVKVTQFKATNHTMLNSGYVTTQLLYYIDTATSVEELSNNDGITVYPTLTHDELTIQRTKAVSDLTVTVIDAQGREVIPAFLIARNDEETLHLNALSAGVYLVRIESPSTTFVKKILKM